MRQILLLLIICSNILFAKQIEIILTDNSYTYIKPDMIVLEDKETGKKYVQYDNIIDFGLLLGVDDGENTSADKFYPNPCNDFANYTVNIKTAGNYNCALYDLAGNIVFSKSQFLLEGLNQMDLKMQGLASGKYFLSLQNGDTFKSVSFIVNSQSNQERSIELSVNTKVESPVINHEKSYYAKIYASGYEVIDTILYSADYTNGEILELSLSRNYLHFNFSVVSVELNLELDSCSFYLQKYNEKDEVIETYSDNIINEENIYEKYSDTIESLFRLKSPYRVEYDSGKYLLDFDFALDGWKIYFEKIKFFIEDDNMIINMNYENEILNKSYDFFYMIKEEEFPDNVNKIKKTYRYNINSILFEKSYFKIYFNVL